MSSIYRRDSLKGDELVGSIDGAGHVFRSDNFTGDQLVGKVEGGRVYLHDSLVGHQLAGEVHRDGEVYRHDTTIGNQVIGRIDANGDVFRHEGIRGPEVYGRVDPPSLEAGAALLLLFRTDDAEPKPSFLKSAASASAGAVVSQAVRQRQEAPKNKRSATQPSPPSAGSAQAAQGIEPLRRVVGVCKFPAPNVSLASENSALTTLQQEGNGERTHHELNKILIDQRSLLHDQRAFIVVVGGSRGYLLDAPRSIPLADLFICCSDEATLKGIGVPVIDASWQPGGDPLRFGAFYDIVNQENYSPTAPQVIAGYEDGGA